MKLKEKSTIKKLKVTVAHTSGVELSSPLGSFDADNPFLIRLLDFSGKTMKDLQAPNLKAARKFAKSLLQTYFKKFPHVQILDEESGRLEGIYTLYVDSMCRLQGV